MYLLVLKIYKIQSDKNMTQTKLTAEIIAEKKAKLQKNINGVSGDDRFSAAYSFIGVLLYNLPRNRWDFLAWKLTKLWNTRNTPPFEEVELRKIFDLLVGRNKKPRLAKQAGK
jgi:hypothetical protein